MELSQSKQKPSERTCDYWIVNNYGGAKKELRSFSFIAK